MTIRQARKIVKREPHFGLYPPHIYSEEQIIAAQVRIRKQNKLLIKMLFRG